MALINLCMILSLALRSVSFVVGPAGHKGVLLKVSRGALAAHARKCNMSMPLSGTLWCFTLALLGYDLHGIGTRFRCKGLEPAAVGEGMQHAWCLPNSLTQCQ